ncbi:hypothetical protein [Arthrobacter sp. AQ5-05]|uniref:hypothetical protein n=1 Tax=Arthrobacter sp. AQ5-05 TaxID=2184581 RepID=UPI0015EB8BEC|nr:hypothetical protein [Arthrobacter sp. AQ5-05]
MEPRKRAAVLGSILLALVLLVILVGIIIGSTGILASGAVGPDPSNGWQAVESRAATGP